VVLLAVFFSKTRLIDNLRLAWNLWTIG